MHACADTDDDLSALFSNTPPAQSKRLRHYYHPPAMGKCFPGHERIEYMSGAIARNGSNFALVANTRVEVGRKRDGGYEFESVSIEPLARRDVVSTRNDYPGFLLDPRKVSLRRASRCRPYGTPRGCRFDEVGRHRKVPSWLTAGKPIELTCRMTTRGDSCTEAPRMERATVGGVCDVEMQPVAGVR